MLVSLPMYDLPELMAAHETFWQGLSRHLVTAGINAPPQALAWPEDLYAHWRDPALLLSQTCGYPLKRQLEDQVRLVGVPIYNAPGCAGILYSSVLVVPRISPWEDIAELRGRRAAHCGTDSQSGYSALRHTVAPHARTGRFFDTITATTRHEESIDLVAGNKADIAAIDCVTFALLQRYQPARLADVRQIGYTAHVAGLSLITAQGRSDDEVACLRLAVTAAFADPALAESRAAMLLGGIAFPDISAYDDIDKLESEAANLGYPVLA